MSSTSYFYIYKDQAGEWRWRFVASNGKIIAVSSEGYHNLTDCEHSVDLVKTDGPRAVVIGDNTYDQLRKTKPAGLGLYS